VTYNEATAQILIELGGKKWKKDGHYRVYMNDVQRWLGYKPFSDSTIWFDVNTATYTGRSMDPFEFDEAMDKLKKAIKEKRRGQAESRQ
jgi:hypothetical protein